MYSKCDKNQQVSWKWTLCGTKGGREWNNERKFVARVTRMSRNDERKPDGPTDIDHEICEQ